MKKTKQGVRDLNSIPAKPKAVPVTAEAKKLVTEGPCRHTKTRTEMVEDFDLDYGTQWYRAIVCTYCDKVLGDAGWR